MSLVAVRKEMVTAIRRWLRLEGKYHNSAEGQILCNSHKGNGSCMVKKAFGR